MMELVQLNTMYNLSSFDCGDPDLNQFLRDDALLFESQQIGKTFLLVDDMTVVAYFCLFNDKISRLETQSNYWRKIKKKFPHAKHFNSYPAVKIGRFAVSSSYHNAGIGSELMWSIKHLLNTGDSYSAFRFLTVDAYLSATAFYEKNGFRMMVADDDDRHTRLMFFDMMEL